jgi:dTDP-4-dehydrorhamnose reductase
MHVSTDYVFDGGKPAPYLEADITSPLNAYGRTKLEGEQGDAAACREHIIVRTAWLHSPFGRNFVTTMLRLARERPEIGVVDDQVGSPTYAPHLAAAILNIAQRVASDRAAAPWGVYHVANAGEASWREVAVAIFSASGELGGPTASVRGISSAEYPTAAKRPANSRLDTTKLARTFGTELPDWRLGISECVARLLAGAPEMASPLAVRK